MSKIDYKSKFAKLYKARGAAVETVDVPEFRFLMIDGAGSPDSQQFAEAVEALFPVAYTLKFMCKKGVQGIDYAVLPLEGLWWAEDMRDFTAANKERWQWTLMIMQPDLISAEMAGDAIEQVRRKKNPPALHGIRFDAFHEGPAAQVLHVGPFADEGPAIRRLHECIAGHGHALSGKHHEIYLSDFRRTATAKLRTILRQPFTPKTVA